MFSHKTYSRKQQKVRKKVSFCARRLSHTSALSHIGSLARRLSRTSALSCSAHLALVESEHEGRSQLVAESSHLLVAEHLFDA